jgi:hypothetical protein
MASVTTQIAGGQLREPGILPLAAVSMQLLLLWLGRRLGGLLLLLGQIWRLPPLLLVRLLLLLRILLLVRQLCWLRFLWLRLLLLLLLWWWHLQQSHQVTAVSAALTARVVISWSSSSYNCSDISWSSSSSRNGCRCGSSYRRQPRWWEVGRLRRGPPPICCRLQAAADGVCCLWPGLLL